VDCRGTPGVRVDAIASGGRATVGYCSQAKRVLILADAGVTAADRDCGNSGCSNW